MADTTIAQEIQLAGIARRIAQSGTPVSVTGTTTETTLATITVPANAMGPSGMVEVLPVFSYTGTAGAKICALKLNGTTIWTGSTGTSILQQKAWLSFHNSNSASAQVASNPSGNTGGVGSGTTAIIRTSFDSTQALTLTITAALASAADSATLEGYLARVTYGS